MTQWEQNLTEPYAYVIGQIVYMLGIVLTWLHIGSEAMWVNYRQRGANSTGNRFSNVGTWWLKLWGKYEKSVS